MKLLTKAILAKLPALYANEEIEDPKVIVKFFTPDSNWTWFATEYSPEQRLFFGLVDGLEREWGYFSLDELESTRGPLGLSIERDMWWTPCMVSELATR